MRPLLLSTLLPPGDEPVLVEARASDIHAIMYTSGTIGPSKGVPVTHLLALANASDVRTFAGCADSTIYCPLPLFHAAALWDGLFSSLLVARLMRAAEIECVRRTSRLRTTGRT